MSYAPEHGPALNLWTERVIFYVQSCGYSWSTVLNYVISYYQKHQDSSADAWFSVDPPRACRKSLRCHSASAKFHRTNHSLSKSQNHYLFELESCSRLQLRRLCTSSHLCNMPIQRTQILSMSIETSFS